MGLMSLTDFYRGNAWRQLRKRLMLERVKADGVLYCEYCNKPIVKASGCIGHHIEPITADNVHNWDIALNPENVQLVHAKCHNYIHEKLGLWTQKVYIVYGAACSGKTSYVKQNKGLNDLVIDLDNIFECITLEKRYVKPDSLKAAAFAVREALYNTIQTRCGNWRTAWVIGSLPYNKDRELLAQRLGAEIVFINADKQTCLERAADNERPKEWAEYIAEWFEDYQAGENDIEVNTSGLKEIVF